MPIPSAPATSTRRSLQRTSEVNLPAVTTVLIVPLAVQWWSTWYPGAEPGGGGYVAQRMLAARDEPESMLATLWFNIAHYALRPWPWVIVALCSLIVYPNLESIQARFPNVDPSIVGHDLAYPAMLVFLPSGLLGLVIASLPPSRSGWRMRCRRSSSCCRSGPGRG